MKSIVTVKIIVIFVIIFGVNYVVARPRNRVKRISDTHLADLETKIALNNKIKGYAITMPIGGGRLNLKDIGRRRRSESNSRLLDALLNKSEEDNGDPIPAADYDAILYNTNYNNLIGYD